MATSPKERDDRSELPLGGDADLTFEVRDLKQLVAELDGRWKAFLERVPFSDRQFRDLKQAVMEMVDNALDWGIGEDRKPWALVTTRIGPEDVTVIVRDRGPGFDLGSFVRPPSTDDVAGILDRLEEIERTLGHRVGFGIMLVRGLADSVSYNERGNEVTLVKRFDAGPCDEFAGSERTPGQP